MIDYIAAGVTEPEDGIVEFHVTQEMIDRVRKKFLTWHTSDKAVLVPCEYPCDAVAIQIFIMTGKFKVGTFRAPKYSQSWTEYRPKKSKTIDE